MYVCMYDTNTTHIHTAHTLMPHALICIDWMRFWRRTQHTYTQHRRRKQYTYTQQEKEDTIHIHTAHTLMPHALICIDWMRLGLTASLAERS
jgi:hypothetical protein